MSYRVGGPRGAETVRMFMVFAEGHSPMVGSWPACEKTDAAAAIALQLGLTASQVIAIEINHGLTYVNNLLEGVAPRDTDGPLFEDLPVVESVRPWRWARRW